MSAHSLDTSSCRIRIYHSRIRSYPTECRRIWWWLLRNKFETEIAEIMTACCGLVAPDGAPQASLFLEFFLHARGIYTFSQEAHGRSHYITVHLQFLCGYLIHLIRTYIRILYIQAALCTQHACCSHINAFSLCKYTQVHPFQQSCTTASKLTEWMGDYVRCIYVHS